MTLGRKGPSSGLKRKPAPRFWPIHRKEANWVVKPAAGPHSTENCIPLAVALRDILDLARTRKEAKKVVAHERVRVDGRVRRKDTFPLGLMDVVSLADMEKHFRVLPSYKGLILHPIDQEEARFKLCRIEDKKIVGKGHVQLNLHDSSNILIKTADPKNPTRDVYETLDTLKIGLPDMQILDRVEAKEEVFAILTGGKNVGKHGKVVEIEKAEGTKRRNTLVTIEDEKGNRYQTIMEFIFAVGKEHPLIMLPEAT